MPHQETWKNGFLKFVKKLYILSSNPRVTIV